MERIVILGAGVMGQRIAAHFLKAGHPVALLDPAPAALDAARAFLGRSDRLVLAGAAAALPTEWRRPAAVIEAVPERLELKRAVIAELETVFGPEVLIASNTSGLPTAALTEGMAHPERFAIAHFFNPADLVPAVEVVPAATTRPELLDHFVALLARSGKAPARLNADIPGFIANRIQHAMMRECFHLLEAGVADAKTIDRVVRYSIGVRLALSGPFMQRDLNGLDTHLAIAGYLYPDLAAGTAPPETLRAKVEAGQLGRKSGAGFYHWDTAMTGHAARAEAGLAQVIATARDLDAQE